MYICYVCVIVVDSIYDFDSCVYFKLSKKMDICSQKTEVNVMLCVSNACSVLLLFICIDFEH